MSRERSFDALFLAGALFSLAPDRILLVLQPIVLALAVFFAARSGRLFEAGNPVRRPWIVLASGLFVLLLGEITEMLYAVAWGIEDPFPSAADLFFLLAYLLLLVTFPLFLRAYRASGLPVRGGRVFLAASVATLALLGFVVLTPMLRSSAPMLERLIGLGYVVFDLLVLLPILLLLRMTWGFRGGGVFRVWAGILFGFILTFVGDLLFACLKTQAPGPMLFPEGAPLDSLADAMFLLSYLAIARGTLQQQDILGR